MGSINFNTFGNWFQKPPNPIPPINLLSGSLLNTPRTLKFASISSSNTSKKAPNLETPPSEEPGKYNKILEQFFWELETMPDFRHTPEVQRILNEDPNFEKKANLTEEEIRENKKWRNEFRSSPVVQFMARAEEIAMKMNEMELEENVNPHWDEDSLYIGEENSEAPPLSPIEAKIQQLAEKFVEVICKSSGRTRQFAAGTEAGFAIYLINKKLDTGVPLALHIEAVKEGEGTCQFWPKCSSCGLWRWMEVRDSH